MKDEKTTNADKPIPAEAENRDQRERSKEARETKPATPPHEARTDEGRGTGELGTEGVDPSQPLSDRRKETGG